MGVFTCLVVKCFNGSSQQPQHPQRLLWGRDALMQSWTTMTPTRGPLPPNCTTRPSHPARKSLMGRWIAWPCSWPVCVTGLDGLIGITSSWCQSMMGGQEAYSPTTGKCPWRTQGHTQLHTSTCQCVMHKTMTCSTIFGLTC